MTANRASVLFIFFFAVLFPAPVRAEGEAVTEFVGRLRQQSARCRSLCSEVRIFVNSGTTDRAKIRELGVRLERELGSVRALLMDYKRAATRFGLQEEYDLLEGIVAQVDFLDKGYGRLTGVQPKPFTAEQKQSGRNAAQKVLREFVPDLVARQLGSQGVADVLTAESFQEATQTAARHLIERVLGELDAEFAAYLDVGVDGAGIEITAREAARRLAKKYIGKLLAKVTTQAFVVEFVAGVIIEWVGPKLKEALRPKGNLEARVQRSKEVLRDAGLLLDRLEGKSSVQAARFAVELAERAIDSTRYLLGDLERAQRTDLTSEMAAAIRRLAQILERTRHRFLIGSEIGQKALDDFIALVDLVTANIQRMRTNAEPGPRPPIVAPDAPPVASADAVAGRYEIREDYWSVNPRPTTSVVISGSMDELEFNLSIRPQSGTPTNWTGRLRWVGGEAGTDRTLKGMSYDQNSSRTQECVMVIRRDERGTWRALLLHHGGNRYPLLKIRSGAPR